MKELERYLEATYSYRCQPDIITETVATFHNPEMPTITDFGTELPKTDSEINYLKKKNTNEAIRQKMRKKDVYKSDMHKIYNIIVGKTNEELQ